MPPGAYEPASCADYVEPSAYACQRWDYSSAWLYQAYLQAVFARPVQTLDEAMEKVKKGDLSIRIHTQSNDEMGRLTRSFNQMTEDLGRYLEDKVQRQKDLNETTLKLYQTQLNPQFSL